MKLLGLAGWSGSGKTTLVCALLPILKARGFAVSTLKHAHCGFDLDQPGKDSFRHREAGAAEVMVASGRRWALLHEIEEARDEPQLESLVKRMNPVDLLLIEGFKTAGHDIIEVHRASLGEPLIAGDNPHVVAVASDSPLDGLAVPRLDLNDPEAVADFIVEHCALEPALLSRRDLLPGT